MQRGDIFIGKKAGYWLIAVLLKENNNSGTSSVYRRTKLDFWELLKITNAFILERIKDDNLEII